MSKTIHIHVHRTKDADPYRSEVAAALQTTKQALSKTSSFSEKLYRESGEKNEHGINARYHLEQAVKALERA